jgi:hypothetical protein
VLQENSRRLFRYGTVNDLIQRDLCSSEVPSILEPAGCSRADGMTLVPWYMGKPLLWELDTSL